MNIIEPTLTPANTPPGTERVVFGATQPEYQPLPALCTPDNKVVSAWELTDEERQRITDGAPIFVTLIDAREPDGTLKTPLLVTVGEPALMETKTTAAPETAPV